MITGEALPVTKRIGDRLIGATLNVQGALVLRAERVGAATVLAQIVQMVAQAQRSRAPMQRMADVVAGYFVMTVVGVALLTLLGWGILGPEPSWVFGLINAVSVLIIACPCALGLATPLSIKVAMGRGATQGVLFRDAAAIEQLRTVDTLLLDKTGTLTEGRARLDCTLPAPGMQGIEVLRLAASLNQGSEHPLAEAMVQAARRQGCVLSAPALFLVLTGRGVSGEVEGRSLVLGSSGLMAECNVDLGALAGQAEALRAQGASVMFLAEQVTLLGLLAVSDPIKSSTPEALAMLKAAGLRIVMATGDSSTTARAVASQLGISEVHGEVTPAGKLALVERLQAMGTGTDVAMTSAQVTLVKGDLRGIAVALSLSAATVRNMKQNLMFALLYNGLGIPVAAGVLYPFTGWLLSPMVAAVAMSFSSVSVIANALRLQRQ
jgi:Cu+-exporting ATPase